MAYRDDHGEHPHGDHQSAEHAHAEHLPAEHPDGQHAQHRHEHSAGWRSRLRELFAPHSHDAGEAVDTELEVSQLGIRTLALSFAMLAATALVQLVVVVLSSSVALLGDTLHNFADALTAVPLAIAFTLGRRAATRRFTYGYGRAEDLAGLVVLALIAASSALAAYEAIRRMLHPVTLHYLGLVAVAALIGFAGNELVARYRIRVGRQIGSAALVADGLHARTDGLTSLAVLLGAGGVALGFPLADPIVGLVITVAILAVLRQAAQEVFARLMDAVDPVLVDRAEQVIGETPGVLDVSTVRIRWIGHTLHAECAVGVDPGLSVVQAHAVADDVEHRLLHQIRRLRSATIHADPESSGSGAHHLLSGHHRQQPR